MKTVFNFDAQIHKKDEKDHCTCFTRTFYTYVTTRLFVIPIFD